MNSSRDVLDEFLWNIKTENFEGAVKCMQLTFKKGHSRVQLIDWAKSCIPFKISSYEIVKRHLRTDVIEETFHTYEVKIYDVNNVMYFCLPNVICETKPFVTSVKGRWGVNPISVIPKHSIVDSSTVMGVKYGKNK